MLSSLLPAGVAVAACREGAVGASLFPAEEDSVSRAIESRRREFAVGRGCAREALAQLGIVPQPIPVGVGGVPLWPVGVVGSITHCAGYRACAVARASDLAAIGIDAEPAAALPRGTLEAIAMPFERARLAALRPRSPGCDWGRLLLCMKEAVYKACFPLGVRLGLGDAEIEIALDGCFSARLLSGAPGGAGELGRLRGRWAVEEGIALAAIAVPASVEAARPAVL